MDLGSQRWYGRCCGNLWIPPKGQKLNLRLQAVCVTGIGLDCTLVFKKKTSVCVTGIGDHGQDAAAALLSRPPHLHITTARCRLHTALNTKSTIVGHAHFFYYYIYHVVDCTLPSAKCTLNCVS